MTTAMSAAIAGRLGAQPGSSSGGSRCLSEPSRGWLADDLGDALRTSAHSDAHKLATSRGMFGLATGSQLAHEVGQKLAATDALPLSEVPRLAALVASRREQFAVHSDGGRAIDGDSTRVELPYNVQLPGGVLELLEAAARSREPWELRLVGSGPLEAQLRARATRRGIAHRVSFAPFVADREELARRYAGRGARRGRGSQTGRTLGAGRLALVTIR